MPIRWMLSLGVLFLTACGGGGSSPSGPSTQPSPTPVPTPVATPVPTPTPTPVPAPGPATLRTASMRGANGHAVQGSARIVRDGSTHRLEFSADFMVGGAANSDVYLTNSTANMQNGRNLGALRSGSGAQAYALSDDGGAFRYVMIWCRPFVIPIGIGELR